MEEGLYLSHGDDPYNLLMINDPPIPISELFLDEKKFEELFGEDASDDDSAGNIGRVPAELSLKYLIQDYKVCRICRADKFFPISPVSETRQVVLRMRIPFR